VSEQVRIGVQLPTVDGFGCGYVELPPLVRSAEDEGFDSVWFGDHLVPNVPIVESIVAASVAAACSKQLRIGFSVMLPALRQPVWWAKQLSSLQAVSGGRIELGVGVGGEVLTEWELAGVPRSERAARTDTILEALPDLLEGRTATLGAPWDLEVPPLLPSAGMPPLWVGGRSEAALTRAVRFQAGWLGLWADEDRLALAAATMRGLAAAMGKPVPTTAVGVMVHPSRDVEEGRRRTAEFIEAIYRIPFQKLSKWVLVGDERTIAERLASLVAAGASTVVMIPAVRDCAEHMASLRVIADNLRKNVANR
jgi:alkanesulfonate monooxygenase SsuD/methylene tetrahydromethanopterin reductase-like flavin-dependent oxidoreductase (luciferase family)